MPLVGVPREVEEGPRRRGFGELILPERVVDALRVPQSGGGKIESGQVAVAFRTRLRVDGVAGAPRERVRLQRPSILDTRRPIPLELLSEGRQQVESADALAHDRPRPSGTRVLDEEGHVEQLDAFQIERVVKKPFDLDEEIAFIQKLLAG